MATKERNFKQAEAEGSDAFFNALLKSCATPTRTSSDYESTPGALGYHDPMKLHRKHSRPERSAAQDSVKDQAEALESQKVLSRLKEKANVPEQWPKRTSSKEGSRRHTRDDRMPVSYQSSSLRTSFESAEEPYIEDGYDHYSDARHDVLRNHGFWPRPGQIVEPAVERTRGNYDSSQALAQGVRKSSERSLYCRPEFTHKNLDIGRSLLLEPLRPPTVSFPPLPAVPPPQSTSGEQACTLFPSRPSDDLAELDLAYESDPYFTFEGTSIFQRRGGSPNTIYSSAWPHIYTTSLASQVRPPFKDPMLEAYRLSDPYLVANIDASMPEVPYRNLSWQTLSREEYILALGHYATTLGIELPAVYAAKSNLQIDWLGEDKVAEAVEKFDEKVEELCKVELDTIERMQRQDERLRREWDMDRTCEGKHEAVTVD